MAVPGGLLPRIDLKIIDSHLRMPGVWLSNPKKSRTIKSNESARETMLRETALIETII
jgi:hypothetical protein